MTRKKKATKRGPTGTVKGIPPEEVTGVLLAAVRRLAKSGLGFTRAEAAAALVEEGMEGEVLDGMLWALVRSVPGIENVGFGAYTLPVEWEAAVEHRLLKVSLPKLNVLEARELQRVMWEQGDDDHKVLRALNSALGKFGEW